MTIIKVHFITFILIAKPFFKEIKHVKRFTETA